jgi:hypothetical protein
MFKYFEEDPKDVEHLGFFPVFSEGLFPVMDFMWLRHKGACIVLLMFVLEEPWTFINNSVFYAQMEAYLDKLMDVQQALLHTKLLKITSSSNKTISQGKFINIRGSFGEACWGIIWMGAE